MKIFLLTISFAFLSAISTQAQLIKLNAVYDPKASAVKLNWNMINYKTKTTYVLLGSTDGKIWKEIVTDKKFEVYNAEDIFDYDDKSFSQEKKNYYCLKIINAYGQAIGYSDIRIVQIEREKGSWSIVKNPVNDLLILNNKGNDFIKGVINIAIYDLTGKAVIKFRAASIYRTIQIPVSKLPGGYYIAQVIVLNELEMNERFLKE